MSFIVSKPLVCFLAVFFLAEPLHAFAEKIYTSKERREEENRISKDIEDKLDWRNRTKETIDDYDDAHRLLYGTFNESILLRQWSPE